ncbi:XRE family transcriptional regulator (plasmid) [Streptomyces sp. NBC_00876]|uniref:telomere-protecting terminal protein Tpg n=1 Tax=Streptomyces sp. NBC_00876 TaxID=2975853 RepID=UPI002F9149AB|nr:XRE family transcriptional regulator [Streptomyces sp. NBC_00876]
MNTVGEGLDEAVQRAFTRPVPKSAGARMRYLVKQLKGTGPVAGLLGISRRTVERYVKNEIKRPRKDLSDRMEREVRKRWQPQVRAKARKNAATTGGIIIDTRARFGYSAAPGTTDDARLRHLTVALPPVYAARLFEAQEQGGTDRQLQEIAAEGLQEIYFKDGGRRAQGLLVEYTDLEHIEFDL